jgi:hypothetical protein
MLGFFFFFLFFGLFIHLFICAYIVWAISSPCPPLPHFQAETCSALFFNVVEETT